MHESTGTAWGLGYCGGKVRIEDYRTKKQRFLPEEEWRMFKDETGLLVPQIVNEELWERANIILARRSIHHDEIVITYRVHISIA